jgi:hypothetical protein
MQDGVKHHGKSACSCCTGHGFSHGSCPCCNQSGAAHQCDIADSDSQRTSCHALSGHHCKSMVKHDVIPVTVPSAVDAGDLHASFFALAAFSQPLHISQSHVGQVVDFDTGRPPNDLVVTLHRLVI